MSDHGLGKCACCGGDATAMYPLLPGQPAFCYAHHNEQHAGKFGCDFSGPDWMDDIDWSQDGDYYSNDELVQDRVWTTKDGKELKLCEMKDEHLLNTHRLIRKTFIKEDEPVADSQMLEMLGAFTVEIERRGLKSKEIVKAPDKSAW